MAHQTEAPGPRYTDADPKKRDSDAGLELLRYYTENGAKPYCDGAPATEEDRAWGQAYLFLTGSDGATIPTVLG